MEVNNSSMNGITSPTLNWIYHWSMFPRLIFHTWIWTNCLLHLMAILMKVSQAISWTPSWVSCMNSNSLFTTVLRNLQWARRKRGYWPTMYIMLEAMMALLSLPFFCSQSPSKSWENNNCVKTVHYGTMDQNVSHHPLKENLTKGKLFKNFIRGRVKNGLR